MSEQLQINNISNNQRIAKNALFLYVRMFFVLAVSLYTSRVTLHVLGVKDFGTYNVVCGFVSMFAFLNTAMANVTQRFYNFELGKNGTNSLTKVYGIAIVTQFVLMIVVIILVEIIGLWYLNVKMVIPDGRLATAQWIFQFSVLSFVFVIMQVPYSAAIMAYEKMNYFAVVSIVDVVVKLGCVIVLQYLQGDKLIFYGFIMLLITVLTFLLYFIYAKRKLLGLTITKPIDKSMLKKMVSFSGWNVFGSFAYIVQNQGVNLLLNSFFGTVINAARGISYQVIGAIQGFSSNVFIAFRPQLVQSYAAGEFARTKNLMFSMSKITFYLFYMFALPVSIEIEYILHLWLGDIVPDYTAIFTVLILMNSLIGNFNTPLSQVIHATGKMKIYQIINSIILCLVIPVAWMCLAMGCSPISAYWVTIVLTICNQIVCLFVVRRFFPFSIKMYISTVISPCALVFVLSSILPIIVHCILPISFFRIVLVALLSVFSVVLLGYFIGMDKNEQEIIKPYTKRIIRK